MFYDIFTVILPVFICAAIGYTWIKMGQPFETVFVSKLVMSVGAPCLIFSTFMEIELDKDVFVSISTAALICLLVFIVVGFLILRFFKLSYSAFLPGQMSGNTGNMGLPLCLLTFGDEGLVLGLAYFMVSSFFGFTIAMSISSGALSFRETLKNPVIWTVVITLTLFFSETKPPVWLHNTTDLIAGITIPLMLFALGVSLAQFKVTSLKRSVSLSILRLGLGFLTGNVVALLMGLEGAARGVVILQCSMPVAVFSYLFALRYKREPEEVAATVVISTVLAFMMLPLLLWYVMP
jgi:predicted permease